MTLRRGCDSKDRPTTYVGASGGWWAGLLVAFAVILSVTASCGGGSGKAVMDSYCRHGSTLVSTLAQINNGTMTRAEAVDKLASVQKNIGSDALAERSSNAEVADKMQAVSDAVGRMKVSVSAGSNGDASEVVSAAGQIQECRK